MKKLQWSGVGVNVRLRTQLHFVTYGYENARICMQCLRREFTRLKLQVVDRGRFEYITASGPRSKKAESDGHCDSLSLSIRLYDEKEMRNVLSI